MAAILFLDSNDQTARLFLRLKLLQKGCTGQAVYRTLKMFKPALFVALLIPELAKADDNFNNCMQGYKTLCDETALSTEQLDQFKQKRSADMLKICKMSVVLCDKDVLLPNDRQQIN